MEEREFIFGAGFGRTGTTSLKKAIEMLTGGKCYHMSEVFKDSKKIQNWLDLHSEVKARNESKEEDPSPLPFDEIYDGYIATTDWPSVGYYKEILAHYPNCKVILTKRSSTEVWYKSFNSTIGKFIRGDVSFLWILGKLGSPNMSSFPKMVNEALNEMTFEGKVDEENVKKFFYLFN